MAVCSKCKREIEHRKKYECKTCNKILCAVCNSACDIMGSKCLKCEERELTSY